MAKFVRETANEPPNRLIFENLMGISAGDMDKRKHEEYLAQLVYKIANDYAAGPSASALDAFYENTPELPLATTNLITAVMKDASLLAKDVKLVKRHSLVPGNMQVLLI